MTQYNLQASTSGKSITCEQDVCTAMFETTSSDCKVGKPCEYMVTYGDGSSSGGYFVKDNIYLDQVSGDYKTSPLQGNIAFGYVSRLISYLLCIYVCMYVLYKHLCYLFFIQHRCSSKQSGDLGTSTNAVDGIIGFGAANNSVISQLAAAGTVKRMFAHCLNGDNGGGIFAIGQVVEPKVNSTPLLPNRYVWQMNSKCCMWSFICKKYTSMLKNLVLI